MYPIRTQAPTVNPNVLSYGKSITAEQLLAAQQAQAMSAQQSQVAPAQTTQPSNIYSDGIINNLPAYLLKDQSALSGVTQPVAPKAPVTATQPVVATPPATAQASQVVTPELPATEPEVAIPVMPATDSPEEAKSFFEENPTVGISLMQVGIALASGGDVNKAIQQGLQTYQAENASKAKAKNDEKTNDREDRKVTLSEQEAKDTRAYHKDLRDIQVATLKATNDRHNTGEENKFKLQAQKQADALLLKDFKAGGGLEADLISNTDVTNYAKTMVGTTTDPDTGLPIQKPVTATDLAVARNQLREQNQLPPYYVAPTAAIKSSALKAGLQAQGDDERSELVLNYAAAYGEKAARELFIKLSKGNKDE